MWSADSEADWMVFLYRENTQYAAFQLMLRQTLLKFVIVLNNKNWLYLLKSQQNDTRYYFDKQYLNNIEMVVNLYHRGPR